MPVEAWSFDCEMRGNLEELQLLLWRVITNEKVSRVGTGVEYDTSQYS